MGGQSCDHSSGAPPATRSGHGHHRRDRPCRRCDRSRPSVRVSSPGAADPPRADRALRRVRRVAELGLTGPVAGGGNKGIAMSISYGDKSVATLRCLVTAIEHQFALLPPPDKVRAAWAELVDVLALGPPPNLRTRP